MKGGYAALHFTFGPSYVIPCGSEYYHNSKGSIFTIAFQPRSLKTVHTCVFLSRRWRQQEVWNPSYRWLYLRLLSAEPIQ